MIQKESFNSAVKDHNLELFVRFQSRDNLSESQYELRTHEVERWVVESDSPIGWGQPFQPYLRSVGCRFHQILLNADASPLPHQNRLADTEILDDGIGRHHRPMALHRCL